MADLPPEGLSETRFGLRFYEPGTHVLCEIIELRRSHGELHGELTVRCNLEGVKGQLDGNRLRQGNFNFSAIGTRTTWAKALSVMVAPELNARLEWGNLLERVSQAVLDWERQGTIHGQTLTGERIGPQGRPWAAWPILPDGEMATLFGPGGVGKTSIVSAIVLSMALGRSLIPGIRVDRPYRVVILDWETNARTAEDLIGTIAESHGVTVPDGIWYEPMDVSLERGLMRVAAVLERANADCVIIDSVRMALASGDPNADASDSISRAYTSLRRINAWGLLIDHVTSSDYRGHRAATKPYGSVYAVNNARHAIGLHVGNRIDSTSEAFLYCPKSNMGADHWAMGGSFLRTDTDLAWSFGEQSFPLYQQLVRDGDDNVSAPEPRLATPPASRRYLDTLAEAPPTGMTVLDVAAELTVAPSTARVILNSLARDGLVASDGVDLGRGHQRHWRLTPTGEAFLRRGTEAVD